jgi:CPA2 family monovalent cation:H+ antiporter-2
VLHAEGLRSLLIFLVAAGIIVPLLHRLRVGTVLGFLLVGLALGPFGLGALAGQFPWLHYVTFDDPKRAEPLAELGIVFLLFLLGLELSLQRLWQLRRYVLGVGLIQVIASAIAIGMIVRWSGIEKPGGIILGLCLALSSTAIVMQLLIDQHRAAAPAGRVALSVLLFQDLMVVPILSIVTILNERHGGQHKSLVELFVPFGQALAVVVLIMVVGKYLVSPLMRSAGRTGSRELIMAITLVIVVGISVVTGASGLSIALGAFIAGILLGESEYRHQIEVDLEPFKGLLLGIFFVTVGMSVDMKAVWTHLHWIALALVGMLVVKATILYFAARLFRVARATAAEVALLLAQAGEFAFIVIGLARGDNLLSQDVATGAIAVAGLSMMVTPLLAILARHIADRLDPDDDDEDIPEDVADMRDHVLIGGFGRVGQTIARVLDSENVPWVAFDTHGTVVSEQRAAGRMVYLGDPSRREFLERAGVKHARAFVVTLGKADATERMATEILKMRPKARIFARAQDSGHATRLTELGCVGVIPETVEASLQLAGRVLEALDFPEDVVDQRVADVRAVELRGVWRATKARKKAAKAGAAE